MHCMQVLDAGGKVNVLYFCTMYCTACTYSMPAQRWHRPKPTPEPTPKADPKSKPMPTLKHKLKPKPAPKNQPEGLRASTASHC